MSARTRDVSPDSGEFRATCSRINAIADELRELGVFGAGGQLGVKTFAAKKKPNPSKNSFDAIQSEEDEDQDEASADEMAEEESDDGHGEFTEVVRKRRSETSHIGQHRVYSKEECETFSVLYNLWFKCYTGKDLNFVITPESQPFISAFEACNELCHVVASLFDRRPVWVDPFGGSGGDTCAALFNMYPEAVHIGEYIYTKEEEVQTKQFSNMEHNIRNMCRLFPALNPEQNPSAPKVYMENKTSEVFIRELDQSVLIDILYLDPNWYKGGPLGETERSPMEMMTYLNHHVIKPLKERGAWPKCIVFKTRWLSQVLWPFMKLLTPDYHPVYSIEATPFRTKVDEKKFKEEGEVRGRFHWVVIAHNELKTIAWTKSDVYDSLFVKREDVYIEECDLVGPHLPAYADNVLFPKRSKRTSGPGLLHIHPPVRKTTGARTKRVVMSNFKSKGKARR
jgi:hypothetical protein